jgi:hypothetical protein
VNAWAGGVLAFGIITTAKAISFRASYWMLTGLTLGTRGAFAPAAVIDVEAVLEPKAAAKGGGGNWRTSLFDF